MDQPSRYCTKHVICISQTRVVSLKPCLTLEKTLVPEVNLVPRNGTEVIMGVDIMATALWGPLGIFVI